MQKIKVLYVEDEPFLGKIVSESLESRQFEVLLVADGRDVLAAYEQFQPDICVLDVMLPHRDGFSLGQEIRQQNPHIPIIFLTAKNQTQDVLQGFESGGNDYIRKPFSQEELIVRIQNLLRISGMAAPVAAPPDGTIRLGRYRFAPMRQELQLENDL
ncbi:MAG TPA: response regulator, partial [Saprospiraceae bacterium]|nr:response regulator [Saprospiraceae bacterium]